MSKIIAPKPQPLARSSQSAPLVPTPTNGNEEVADLTFLKFKNLIGDNRVARPQQQTIVQNIGRVYGNRAVQRVLAQSKSSAPKSTRSQPLISLVQRFDSFEHQSLGNNATGNAKINLGGTAPGQQFELLHGDLVALSGDYFLTDDLLRLAAQPGNNGDAVGTRDEIIYALQDMDKDRHQDARFQPGGMWSKFSFSDKVIAAVDQRYTKLAAANNAHFAAPHGRNTTGKNKGQAIQDTGGGGTAGSTYRANHERALAAAYQAGQSGGTLDQGMAFEAAGQHYLTDAFSAGHARTPIGSIREYWKSKYPLFWYNFLHKIALDTATAMNAQPANITYVVTVKMLYERIMAQVEQIASTLPEINFGDLVAKVFHDYDNEHGLEIKGGGRIFGDDHLDDADPQNVTRKLAEGAIQAGNQDVTKVFALGQTQAGGPTVPMPDTALQKAVRAASRVSGSSYAAETMIPTLSPANPAQNWKAASAEELWTKPIVAGSSLTVGSQITATFQAGKETRQKLEDLAAQFPPTQMGMQPRAAYQQGFLTPLVSNLQTGLLAIINWSPNYGLSYLDTDDVSLATGQQLDSRNQLGGMTTPARASYVRELIDGSVAPDEEDMVVRLFQTAPVAQRPLVYKQVEGHDWNGNWKYENDIPVINPADALWKKLDKPHRVRLRKIINGQAVGKP